MAFGNIQVYQLQNKQVINHKYPTESSRFDVTNHVEAAAVNHAIVHKRVHPN